jgi:integrase
MPRSSRKVPSYCLHKASGQAVVRSDGQDVYLGPYGSPESHRRYQAVVAEWRARHAAAVAAETVPTVAPRAFLTIAELVARYREFALQYYSFEGQPTREFNCMKYALRPLRKLYGDHLAAEFGPVALKALRQHLIDQGLCRKLINNRINRINRVRRFFKWAVSEELIPAAVYEALRTVDGLRYGKTTARESAPVRPVDDATVDATLPFVSPVVAAMIRIQRQTGMRPNEVVQMRLCDIDRSQDVWIYEPGQHKNRWRGHRRLVPLGPQAQAILEPFLNRPAEAFLFSPRESEAWRNEQRASQRKPDRKTKIYPCELKARERRKAAARRRVSRRPKGDQFTVASYRRAITYGIQKANRQGLPIPHWHPHQLRHTRATELRRAYGVEAAQVALGHARADVTEIYAERNLKLAEKIALEIG